MNRLARFLRSTGHSVDDVSGDMGAIMGDHDNFMPMERIVAMKEAFPKVRFEIVENCGHNSFIEQTDTVVSIVKSFMI